jgi:hypothetical protein
MRHSMHSSWRHPMCHSMQHPASSRWGVRVVVLLLMASRKPFPGLKILLHCSSQLSLILLSSFCTFCTHLVLYSFIHFVLSSWFALFVSFTLSLLYSTYAVLIFRILYSKHDVNEFVQFLLNSYLVCVTDFPPVPTLF